VEGEGVGAVRTLTLAGGATLQERLESLDPKARSFQYSILGESPLPVRDYLSTLTLEPRGPNRCHVTWSSEFEPVGVAEEQAVAMIEGVYRGGISSLKSTLGA